MYEMHCGILSSVQKALITLYEFLDSGKEEYIDAMLFCLTGDTCDMLEIS